MSFSFVEFCLIFFQFHLNFVLNVVFKFISITTIVFNFIFNTIALLCDKMNKKLDRYRACERDTFSIGRKYERNSNPYR
jgi:hypothetical protein